MLVTVWLFHTSIHVRVSVGVWCQCWSPSVNGATPLPSGVQW